MSLWVTLRSGEVRQYNRCHVFDYDEAGEWVSLRASEEEKQRGRIIAKLRVSDLTSLEFERPCQVTWTDDPLTRAIAILQSRLGRAPEPSRAVSQKLAPLARVLRRLNLRTYQWT